MNDLIKKTFEELEVKALHPLRWMVFVRTLPLEQKTESGKLWLPPSCTDMYPSMYVELPHLRIVRAIVLAAGPKAYAANPGDTILFKRLHFAYWKKMADGTYVGWLDYNDVIGFDAEDPHESQDHDRDVPGEAAADREAATDGAEDLRGEARSDCGEAVRDSAG
jgi:hypothetical protein